MKIAIGISNPKSGNQMLVLAMAEEVAEKLTTEFGGASFRLAKLTDGYAELEPAARGENGSSRLSKPNANGCRLAFKVPSGTPDFALNSHEPQLGVINCGRLVIELPHPARRKPALVKNVRKRRTKTELAPTTVLFLTEGGNFDVPQDVAKLVFNLLNPFRREE